jgi:hypothetical protein
MSHQQSEYQNQQIERSLAVVGDGRRWAMTTAAMPFKIQDARCEEAETRITVTVL